jgi:small subunit ribosomal protein S18
MIPIITKLSIMTTESTQTPAQHVDYKDISRLHANVNPHARMHGRRRTGMTAKEQRNFATAIKRSRFMALMPYIQR